MDARTDPPPADAVTPPEPAAIRPPAAAEPEVPPRPPVLRDAGFGAALALLKSVQRTIIFENVKVDPADQPLLDLGDLNVLQMTSDTSNASARRAYVAEWAEVEGRLRKLIKYLSDRQIAKIQLNQVTGLLLLYPIYLLLFSIGSLVGFVSADDSWKVPLFICWLATTGGLGSAAFIYVNALSIQVDPTVDFISPGMVQMRVVLGMLFAVVLALPFGFQAFQTFVANLLPKTPAGPLDVKDGLLLLLPFILGFSTPLVLSILNRFVQSAQTFFGVQPDGGRRAQ